MMRGIPYTRLFLFALIMIMVCAAIPSFAQVSVVVSIAPPDLPVYDQPVCPADGYIWTPGYWAWDGEEYYWVPGTWVEAPEPGYLWTPAYWAWNGSAFEFYDGYWAEQVGFYGGINYGFGYFGDGFVGGRWDHGHFSYNRSITNVNVTVIHNVYNTPVANNTAVTRVSYNGGNGGITARATPQQEAVAHARHVPPVAAQVQHVQAARSNQQMRASVNHGKPPVAATPKAGDFKGHGVVTAKQGGAVHNAPAESRNNAGNEAGNRAQNNPTNGRNVVHPNELPPAGHPAAPNTGNVKMDQKLQKQQQKLEAQQEQERQKLQQQQDREHQQFAKKNGSDAGKQQMEQRHQQQTQQLAQKQNHAQQNLREKQQPPAPTAKKEDRH